MSAPGASRAEGRLSERGEAKARRARPRARAAADALMFRYALRSHEAARRRAIDRRPTLQQFGGIGRCKEAE